MPTYIVRGKAKITSTLQIERRIVAPTPALARLEMSRLVQRRYDADIKIDSCEEEGKGGQAQHRLEGSGD